MNYDQANLMFPLTPFSGPEWHVPTQLNSHNINMPGQERYKMWLSAMVPFIAEFAVLHHTNSAHACILVHVAVNSLIQYSHLNKPMKQTSEARTENLHNTERLKMFFLQKRRRCTFGNML